jgi:hypothetical protein
LIVPPLDIWQHFSETTKRLTVWSDPMVASDSLKAAISPDKPESRIPKQLIPRSRHDQFPVKTERLIGRTKLEE